MWWKRSRRFWTCGSVRDTEGEKFLRTVLAVSLLALAAWGVRKKRRKSYFSIEKEALRARQAYREKEDGTLCLTVNAVWPKENMEKAFCHEVVIRPMEDGGFRYVSNRMVLSAEQEELSRQEGKSAF